MTGGGTVVIASAGELTISGSGRKNLGNLTLENNGSLIEASVGNNALVDLDGTAVLNNKGVFDIQGNTAWFDYDGAAGSLMLNNSGTLKKSAGSGVFQFKNTSFNNSGTIEILIGSIQVNGITI